MRKGCVFSATLLVILIAVGGYFGYTLIRQNFDLPDDLAPYAEADSLAEFIHSREPAPPDTAHLTAGRVELFIGAFDSLNTGWYNLNRTFDSLGLGNNGKKLDIWESPSVFRELVKLPLLTRKGLASYLNARNLSLAEYVWLKERTVAASGITHQDVADCFRDSLARYVNVSDSIPLNSSEKLLSFFNRVEELRRSGAIDSSDIALAAPYRQTILRKGMGVFLGPEGDDALPAAMINLE